MLRRFERDHDVSVAPPMPYAHRQNVVDPDPLSGLRPPLGNQTIPRHTEELGAHRSFVAGHVDIQNEIGFHLVHHAHGPGVGADAVVAPRDADIAKSLRTLRSFYGIQRRLRWASESRSRLITTNERFKTCLDDIASRHLLVLRNDRAALRAFREKGFGLGKDLRSYKFR